MSGSVDLKIYYVEKDGKKLNSIAINEAAEENNWSKSRLILMWVYYKIIISQRYLTYTQTYSLRRRTP